MFPTPRGIERVDLAIARQIFSGTQCSNIGLLPTPFGPRLFPASSVNRLISHLEKAWCEDIIAEADPEMTKLISRLNTSQQIGKSNPKLKKVSHLEKFYRLMAMLQKSRLGLGSSAKEHLPLNSIYLNMGQMSPSVSRLFDWLKQRSDVFCAIMIHDMIPIDRPHLVRVANVNHHRRVLKTASSHADCLIFNSAYSKNGVLDAIHKEKNRKIPSVVRWLPLPKAYEDSHSSHPDLKDLNYFVVVSTIEPRKNHSLLIRVWNRLTKKLGTQAPHLVIVGSMGYKSMEILDALQMDPLLASRVHQISGLSSPSLASLVLGASGMLCPSLVEGFGLPVLEGRAMGVPVLASDIEAHREIGTSDTVFLSPDDDQAWEKAILGVPECGSRLRPDIPQQITEETYAKDIIDLVRAEASKVEASKMAQLVKLAEREIAN